MTRDEVLTVLDLPREEAVAVVLALAEKAEKYDLIMRSGATTPSGMTPVYLKHSHRKKKKAGRAKGHPGAGRRRPVRIDRHETIRSTAARTATPLSGNPWMRTDG